LVTDIVDAGVTVRAVTRRPGSAGFPAAVQLVTAAADGLEAIPLDLGRFDNRAASEECRSATGPGAVCAVGTSPRGGVSID
jgi:hypothetical protein